MEDQKVAHNEVPAETQCSHGECDHNHDDEFAVTAEQVEEAMREDIDLTRSAADRLEKYLNRKTELLRRFNAKVRRSRIRSKIARQSRKINRGN